MLEHFFYGRTGHFVVPQIVSHLVKLVKDHQIFARVAQFPAFIKDFLDVALRTRRFDGFTGHFGQPIKPFLAHAFRQNGHRFAG